VDRVRSYDEADLAIVPDDSLWSVNNGLGKLETVWRWWPQVNGSLAWPLNPVLFEEAEPGCAAFPIPSTQRWMAKACNLAW
jgi:hypothetical protein